MEEQFCKVAMSDITGGQTQEEWSKYTMVSSLCFESILLLLMCIGSTLMSQKLYFRI